MKKLYPSGRAMPTRTGSSEPKQSSHATSRERLTASPKSLLRAKSVSPFYSYRRQAMVGSMSATSNLYDVLKRVDWLAIFSPWAIINRSKMYAMTTKQNTCAARTPANNAVLQNFEKTHEDAEPVVSNRACELTEGNILSSRSQRDTDTSATRTTAKNVALQNFEKMHEDAEPVVSKFFSGEFFGSFFGVKKERPVAASDGKVAGRVNKTLSTSMDHTSSSSHLHLLSTIFVSVFICFSGAAKAQSRQDVGTAEVVDAFREAIIIKDEPLLDSLLRIKYPFIDFDRYPVRQYKIDTASLK